MKRKAINGHEEHRERREGTGADGFADSDRSTPGSSPQQAKDALAGGPVAPLAPDDRLKRGDFAPRSLLILPRTDADERGSGKTKTYDGGTETRRTAEKILLLINADNTDGDREMPMSPKVKSKTFLRMQAWISADGDGGSSQIEMKEVSSAASCSHVHHRIPLVRQVKTLLTEEFQIRTSQIGKYVGKKWSLYQKKWFRVSAGLVVFTAVDRKTV